MEEGKNGHWLSNGTSLPHLGRYFHLFTSVFLTLRFRCVTYKQHVARLGFSLSCIVFLCLFCLLICLVLFVTCPLYSYFPRSFIFYFLLFLLFLSVLDELHFLPTPFHLKLMFLFLPNHPGSFSNYPLLHLHIVLLQCFSFRLF